jgi:hypothetical protein
LLALVMLMAGAVGDGYSVMENNSFLLFKNNRSLPIRQVTS